MTTQGSTSFTRWSMGIICGPSPVHENLPTHVVFGPTECRRRSFLFLAMQRITISATRSSPRDVALCINTASSIQLLHMSGWSSQTR
eukprot:3055229-Amphidinium_carterae.1